MELKSRQTYILRALLVTGKGVAPEEFLEKMGVGKRTMYYDLEKINDWLKYYKLGKVVISGQIIRAEVPDTLALEQQLREGTTYFFSVEERRAMEVVHISLASENITINRLMELFSVSKNTILSDIKEVRGLMEGWGLSLSSTIKAGYMIMGEEMTIRKMLGGQFQMLSSPGCQMCIHHFLQKSLVCLYHNEIDFGELCRCLIKQYETDIHGDYILANIELIRMMIQVSWIRSRKGDIIQLSSDEQLALMKSLSFRSVEFSLQKLRVHGVEVAMQETYYITTLFLGIQTTDFLSQEQEDTFIAEFAEELVLSFERIACLSFPNRERLQKQLSHHIRPMYYRIKYGIPDKNPLVKDIKAMYPFVFDFTQKAVQAAKMDLSAGGISEDELAYLCVYFVSNLSEKYLVKENADSKGVLIVGAENMAVVVLMREQLQDLFGLSLDYRVISQSKLREWMLGDYALVVSLVPLSKGFTCKKLVETGPIITENTQRRIMEILRGDRSVARYDEMICEIIKRVKGSVSGNVQDDKLYLDLFRYFEEKDRGKRPRAKSDIFYEKIEQNKFLVLPETANLKQTLLSCSKVLRPGAAGQRLAQRMFNLLQNKKLQTYRIQEDVVLVHFPLQGDANPQIDVCIALAPKEMVCPDGENTRILVGLATKDSHSHWAVLESIYRYFNDRNHVNGIKQLYQNDKEQYE
nr:BglG family transcription antiterminator [uncultured Caproiciproducens sp.]